MSKKLIGIFASVALVLSLAGANVASALTASDISMLLGAGIISASQAATLTASLAPASVTVSAGYNFAKDLTIGSKGADVTALQNLLGVSPATGFFGAKTKAALITFQLSKGITPASGYFGAKTRKIANASAGTTVSNGTTTVVPTGTSVAVSLAASSPVSGAIIAGQAAADLAEYTFQNTSAAPAVVTNVTLQRGGVSADTSLSNVYLFQGAVRLTDAATVSAGKITFNAGQGLFTIPAGSSVTIAVKSDILLSAAAGQTVNVSLLSVTLGSTSQVVSAVYPVSGAVMTVASAGDISPLSLAKVAVSQSVTAGTLSQTIWSANLSGITRYVWLKSLAVKVIGSIPSNSLQNLNLYISGIQAATASGVDANGMITFDLTAKPYKIDSSRTLEVRADIVNGSSRSFSLSLQNAADISVIDSNYNVGIAASGLPITTDNISVTVGNVSISQDSNLSAGNIVYGSTNIPLAQYTLKAYGEDEKISYLNISANQKLSNVALYANGIAISSSQNVLPTASTLFSLGSSLVIGANQTVTLTVKGDLKDSTGSSTPVGSQVIITLGGYANNTQGSYSSQMCTFPGTGGTIAGCPTVVSTIAGPTMTIVGGGLTVSTNASFNNSSITANSTGVKIGSFNLSSNSSEPVRITTLVLGIASSSTLPLSGLSNLKISDANTSVNPQSSNNFGVNFTIPANGTHVVDVFADVGALAGIANSASTNVTSTTTGTTATYATGTITVSSPSLQASTTVNGVLYAVNIANATQSTSTTAAQLATAIQNGQSGVVTATANAGVITLTSVAIGTGNGINTGNAITMVAGGNTAVNGATLVGGTAGTASTATVQPGSIVAGNTFTLKVNGITYSYVANTGDTNISVSDGLKAAIGSALSGIATINATGNTSVIITASPITSANNTIVQGVTSGTITGTTSLTNQIITSLAVTATGVNSNIDASQVTPIYGQVLTVGNGSLSTTGLASGITPTSAQLVIGGSTSANAVIGTYTFKSTIGTSVITDLGFMASSTNLNAITSISVGGVTVPVSAGATTTISGLNIQIPVSNVGTNIPVSVAYNTVGVTAGGITSGVPVQLVLTSVKYQAGNNTTTFYPNKPTLAMSPVAAYPLVSLVSSSRTGLSNSTSVKLADITITVVGKTVEMSTIGVTVSLGKTASTTGSALILKDNNNTIVATSSAIGTDGANRTLTFVPTYNLAPGTYNYALYGSVSAVTSGVNTDSLTTQLSAPTTLGWYDVEGNSSLLDATLIPSYNTSNQAYLSN